MVLHRTRSSNTLFHRQIKVVIVHEVKLMKEKNDLENVDHEGTKKNVDHEGTITVVNDEKTFFNNYICRSQ